MVPDDQLSLQRRESQQGVKSTIDRRLTNTSAPPSAADIAQRQQVSPPASRIYRHRSGANHDHLGFAATIAAADIALPDLL